MNSVSSSSGSLVPTEKSAGGRFFRSGERGEMRKARLAPILPAGGIRLREFLHVNRAQPQPLLVAKVFLAGRHRKVKGAVEKIRGAKAGEAVAVAHAHQRDGGEGWSGGIPAKR